MNSSDSTQFQGFLRPDGAVGVRNYVAVIPSVFCANHVAQKIAEPFEGVVALCHSLGCSHTGLDLELASRTLTGMGRHPNVGAVLVVGLGHERLTPSELVQAITPTGKPVEQILVEQAGNLIPAVHEGRAIVERFLKLLEEQSRVTCHAGTLTIAVASEGLDASSLLSSSPSIGAAVDMLIDLGGTAVFSGSEGLLGAEGVLMERACCAEVAQDVRRVMAQTQSRLLNRRDTASGKRGYGVPWACVSGGITTVREKALGSLAKSGSKPLAGVFGHAEPIPSRGVYLMDGPVGEAESLTGMVAGGAQIAVLTTCHGTSGGFPIVPVVKVAGSPGVYDLMRENVDVNAGMVLRGEMTVQEVGQEIFSLVLEVASGEPSLAELSSLQDLFALF